MLQDAGGRVALSSAPRDGAERSIRERYFVITMSPIWTAHGVASEIVARR